jgi:ferric-dicitrate binding protein FerR (iron transport regulator)
VKAVPLRLPSALIDELDAYATAMRARHPGRRSASRAHAARTLLAEALLALQAGAPEPVWEMGRSEPAKLATLSLKRVKLRLPDGMRTELDAHRKRVLARRPRGKTSPSLADIVRTLLRQRLSMSMLAEQNADRHATQGPA